MNQVQEFIQRIKNEIKSAKCRGFINRYLTPTGVVDPKDFEKLTETDKDIIYLYRQPETTIKQFFEAWEKSKKVKGMIFMCNNFSGLRSKFRSAIAQETAAEIQVAKELNALDALFRNNYGQSIFLSSGCKLLSHTIGCNVFKDEEDFNTMFEEEETRESLKRMMDEGEFPLIGDDDDEEFTTPKRQRIEVSEPPDLRRQMKHYTQIEPFPVIPFPELF
jgi:hypothetical protein